MSSETPAKQQPAENNQQSARPAGYQPSIGRKLFMFGLCIAGLIFVWTYYYFATRGH